MEECFKTGENKLVVGFGAEREQEQKDAGNQCGYCNGVLSTNVFHVDGIRGDKRTWNTDDRRDSIVPIHNVVRRRWYILASVLKILW